MGTPAPTPQTLLNPIGADAAGGNITAPMPQTQPGTANAASIDVAFPAITMQAEQAGGLPPLGQDMNGMLFLISSHTMWVQCGQLYLFDSDLATAIGGYLQGSILGMADGSGIWLCVNPDGSSNNPDTTSTTDWVPLYSYGYASITGLTGGTYTVTNAQSKKGVLVLSGTLAANQVVQLPQTVQEWLIINMTSGAFTLTVNTAAAGSTGLTIPQGGFGAPTGVYSVGDGNIYPTVAPLSVPISQNPDPSTIVERTSAGYVLATYFNQNSAYNENPSITSVAVMSGTDGYFRWSTLAHLEATMALSAIGGQIQPSQIVQSAVTQFAAAILASAALTGTPTAPTAAVGASSSQVANTAFVNPALTVNSNGVAMQLANGYWIMFGPVNASGWSSDPVDVAITFPRAFPTGVIAAGAFSNRTVASRGQATNGSGYASPTSVNGMTVTVDAPTGFWIAFGK